MPVARLRNRSTTAVQSLLLLNSDLALDAARRLAVAVEGVSADRKARVQELYLRVFSRRATASEVKDAIEFWQRQSELLRNDRFGSPRQPERAALIDLCRALLNTNEFLYLE